MDYQLTISDREFLVVGIEGDNPINEKICLVDLFRIKDSCEMIYSLQLEIDPILDMKKGQSKYVVINRDNPESLGVIKRIK